MDVGKSRHTKNVSGSKLCRHDRGILAKCADIWLSRRHVADMSATFSAKFCADQWVGELGAQGQEQEGCFKDKLEEGQKGGQENEQQE